MLGRYGHLEDIPRSGAWDVQVRGADGLQARLAEQWDDVLLYRELATLAHDVPLPEELADLEHGGVPREPFLAICDRLGVETLRDRPTRWA